MLAVVRLAYVVPGIGLSSEEIARRKEVASRIVGRDVDVDIVTVSWGPKSIENRVEEAFASVSYLPYLYKFSGTYDGFVVGCFGDPGLRAAREITDKPIVGPAETTLHVASMLADSFAIVVPLRSTVKLVSDVVRDYGYRDRVTSIVPIEMPVLELAKRKEEAVDNIVKKIEEGVLTRDAEALILGCMSMGFSLLDDLLGNRLGIPVLNPVKISLKMLEMLVKLGLKQSRMAYPKARLDKITHLINL